jgi:hypothetical protein
MICIKPPPSILQCVLTPPRRAVRHPAQASRPPQRPEADRDQVGVGVGVVELGNRRLIICLFIVFYGWLPKSGLFTSNIRLPFFFLKSILYFMVYLTRSAVSQCHSERGEVLGVLRGSACLPHTRQVPHTLYPINPISCILYHIPLYPIHYTLYTIHYTLYTIHYTLCPIPYTLYPIPYTLYPIPYTLYPIPYTLYPIPYILYPIPYTLYPIPYILYHMPLYPIPYIPYILYLIPDTLSTLYPTPPDPDLDPCLDPDPIPHTLALKPLTLTLTLTHNPNPIHQNSSFLYYTYLLNPPFLCYLYLLNPPSIL